MVTRNVILSAAKNLMQNDCAVLQILHSASGSVQDDKNRLRPW